jgi:lactate dehydrogenase-like 2-hydroxyacid dehydrogenase
MDIWVLMCMKVKTLSSLRIYQIQYKDDQIERLMSFNNVLITPHQAFTKEALDEIARITIHNFIF